MAIRTYTNTSNIEQIYYDKMGVARLLTPGQSFQEEVIPGERNLILGGKELDFAGVVVNVLARDRDGNVLFAHGTAVPSQKAGFAKGCLFIKTDAPDGSKSVYENTGLTSAAFFNVIGDISGAEIADGAITNVKVANDAAIAGTKISPDFGSQNIVSKGHAAVGSNANFDSLQVINVNEISSQLYIYGLYANIQPIYSGDSSVAVGVMGQVNRDTAADFGTIYGGYFNAYAINNSGPQKTIDTLEGLSVSAVSSGDYTTVNYLYGLSSQVSVAHNMVSEAIGEMVAGSFLIYLGSGQVDVTLAKTLSVDAQKGGTITGSLGTLYGVYIGDHSGLGFSMGYNLYSAGAASKNRFEGSVGIGEADPTDGQMLRVSKDDYESFVGIGVYGGWSPSGNQETMYGVSINLVNQSYPNGQGTQFSYGIYEGIEGKGDLYGTYFTGSVRTYGWSQNAEAAKACTLYSMLGAHANEYSSIQIGTMVGIDLDSELIADPANQSPYPGTISLSNWHGIRIGESLVRSGNVSLTNSYGIYIKQVPSGSSNTFHLYSAGMGSRNKLEGNLEFGNAATVVAALADTVRLFGKDFAAGDARLYIQSEQGDPVVIGGDEIRFKGAVVNLGANKGLQIDVVRSPVDLSGENILGKFHQTFTLTGNTSNWVYGISQRTEFVSTAYDLSPSTLVGINSLVLLQEDNVGGAVYGIWNRVQSNNAVNTLVGEIAESLLYISAMTASVSGVIGQQVRAQASSNIAANLSLSKLAGIEVTVACEVSAATMSVAEIFGINLTAPSSGPSVSYAYGLYVDDYSGVGASVHYNIISKGPNSKNLFEGRVGIGVDPTAAILHVTGIADYIGAYIRPTVQVRDSSVYGLYVEPVTATPYGFDGSSLYGVYVRPMIQNGSTAINNLIGIHVHPSVMTGGGPPNNMFAGVSVSGYSAVAQNLWHGVSVQPANCAGGVNEFIGLIIYEHSVGLVDNFNIASRGPGSRNQFEGNLELGNAATVIAGLVDTVRLYGKDYAAGDARLYIQAEGGNPIVIGNNEIQISSLKVLGARVIDARADDVVDAIWDSTDAGVLQAVRDAMIAHGLLAAA